MLEIAFILYAVLSLGSMATMSIGAGLAGLAFVVHVAQGRFDFERAKQNHVLRRFLGFAFLYAGACLVSVAAAWIWPPAYNGIASRPEIGGAIAKLWFLFGPLVVAAGLAELDEKGRTRVMTAWIVTAAIVSIVGLQQVFTGWPRDQEIPNMTGPIRYHATLFLGHHLSTASIWIFPAFAAIDLVVRRGVRWCIPAALITSVVTLLSVARSVWVGFPVGLMVYALATLKRRYAIMLAVVGAALLVGSYQVPQIKKRFESSGLQQRVYLWEANWAFFQDRPVTGAGFRNTISLSHSYLTEKHPEGGWFASHAHSNVLDVLGATGSLGLIGWLCWIGFPFLLLLKRVRQPLGLEREFAMGLLAAFVVFQINGLTQVNFWEAKVQHQLNWMIGWTLFWAGFKKQESWKNT